MTLRDLTKRQLYNLRRRLNKNLREAQKLPTHYLKDVDTAFKFGFDKGVRATLEQFNR